MPAPTPSGTLPFDPKIELFRSAFEQALPMEDYLRGANPTHVDRWKGYTGRVELTSAQKELLSGFRRTMNVLVLSGVWCGDCARQCPMVQAIASATKVMNVRFLDRDVVPAVRDELRLLGGSRVPVAVTLSEDFLEVGRYGDRVLAAYRRKAEKELGDACDPGIIPLSPPEIAEEVEEWMQVFERHHLMLRLASALRHRYND